MDDELTTECGEDESNFCIVDQAEKKILAHKRRIVGAFGQPLLFLIALEFGFRLYLKEQTVAIILTF